jgi:hypothetical protein
MIMGSSTPSTDVASKGKSGLCCSLILFQGNRLSLLQTLIRQSFVIDIIQLCADQMLSAFVSVPSLMAGERA